MPAFEYVKTTLLEAWKSVGSIQISDMPNGYMLIHCGSHEEQQKILFGGPWTVNGITLQLAPWHPWFEPTSSKLSRAAMWIQMHNLPVDYWDGDSLESIIEPISKLLKINECTESLSRARFPTVCLELDLSKPLKRGLWLDDRERRIFVILLYELVPTFCYHYGLVGHGTNSCHR